MKNKALPFSYKRTDGLKRKARIKHIMYGESVKIPKERIAILVGKKGETKKKIEELTKTKIRISKSGEVSIFGEGDGVYFSSQIVKAIGRGFNPKIAIKLLSPEYNLYIFDLYDYYNTKNALIRIKGRVIGEKGRAKQAIERATDCYISVYGDTISIIAPYYTMRYAKEAVEKLIRGSRHSTVERFLAKAREEIMFLKLKGEKGWRAKNEG